MFFFTIPNVQHIELLLMTQNNFNNVTCLDSLRTPLVCYCCRQPFEHYHYPAKVYINCSCYSHVLFLLPVPANKSHSGVQHRATGRDITTTVFIQAHLCSELQLPMISFISLQTSTPQHSGLHRGHYQSNRHQKRKKKWGGRRAQTHIFRKFCSVHSCGKLVLLRFPIFSLLCFTVPLHRPGGL